MSAVFKVGETYSERFMCDYDSIAHFTILARTAKTITTEVHGKRVVRRVRVSDYDGCERFSPFGSYSMAMVVSAKDAPREDKPMKDADERRAFVEETESADAVADLEAVENMVTPLGAYVAQTGGNCTAWRIDRGSEYALITFYEGDHEGDPKEAHWMVGRYTVDVPDSINFCDDVTLADAVAMVRLWFNEKVAA